MASKPNHFRNEFSDFANREVVATPNVHNVPHPLACEDWSQLFSGKFIRNTQASALSSLQRNSLRRFPAPQTSTCEARVILREPILC